MLIFKLFCLKTLNLKLIYFEDKINILNKQIDILFY